MCRKDVKEDLKRASQNDDFFVELSCNPTEALRDYNLTSEKYIALTSGIVQCIESRVGKLNKDMRRWLICRLQQDI